MSSGRSWHISEECAAELDSLAKKLLNTCSDLEAANKKFVRVVSDNPGLGPNKDEIESNILSIQAIAEGAKGDTEALAAKISATAGRIRDLLK